jgi:hypothetical protein
MPNYRAPKLTRQYSIPVTLKHTAIRTSNFIGIYHLFLNHSYCDGIEEEEKEEEMTGNVVYMGKIER